MYNIYYIEYGTNCNVQFETEEEVQAFIDANNLVRVEDPENDDECRVEIQ